MESGSAKWMAPSVVNISSSESADWFVENIASGRRVSFRHYEKLLRRILFATQKGAECGASRGYATVDGEGNIYACHRQAHSLIGHIAYGIDEELRWKWCENRIYARGGCLDCWARYVCGGGCRYNSLEQGKDISIPSKIDCEIRRIQVKNCLWIAAKLPHLKLLDLFSDSKDKNSTAR